MPNELNRLIEKELSERYPAGTDFVVLGYAKLTGQETSDLRRTLRDGRVRIEVVKNSIARRAMKLNGLDAGAPFLEGPCALASGEVEAPELCKVLSDLAKKLEGKLTIRGAVVDGVGVSPAGVVTLASIPPLPVLHARFIGSVQAPMTRVAGAFQAVLRGLAYALEGIRAKKESSGSPLVPEAAASEPAPGPA
jgi:large subunit ribosomal protein L10